jgi:hypothetical protein
LSNTKLIASSPGIDVFFLDGASRYTLLTFAPLGLLSNGHRFWAETPARKLKLRTIGFIAKRQNWYPEHEMLALFKEIESLVGSSLPKILYGNSMGGYAALKYSKLFGAHTTIALGPQFSINPADVTTHDYRYAKFFDPAMHSDMAVKAGDLAGKIFVMADPKATEDAFHVA